jgi:cytochrome b561
MAANYTAPARWFHWIVAGLLLLQIPLAWFMTWQPVGPDKLGNYALHKSVGLLIFGVMALRLAWRITHPVPPLPPTLPRWQRFGAGFTQWVLMVLLFAMPLSGWLMSSAANFPVSFFGLYTLPNLVEPDKARVPGFIRMHELQSYILLGLITLHAAAAFYHHRVKRDDILQRMLPRRTGR